MVAGFWIRFGSAGRGEAGRRIGSTSMDYSIIAVERGRLGRWLNETG